ncbi:MAG TPA: hypothetical protein PLO31_08710 [Dysgonamonadaceae bacterium]|jgi:hypothetical protein|nr:hypothetical protein [Dysgonamonadaceae bacterium]
MNLEKQIEELNSVNDKEWRKIIIELTKWVKMRLMYKTNYGAHSDYNLGGDPVKHYVIGAIDKLYEGTWEWKFEKYSLLDQLKAIAGSMMSENVRKIESKKVTMVPTEMEELVQFSDQNSWDEEANEKEMENEQLFYEALEACSNGDEDLSLYALAIQLYRSGDEICSELNWDKEKMYAVHRKLLRRATSFINHRKH